MSTVSVTNLKHESASGNNITLTSAGNVLIGGTTFDTGAFSGSAGGVNVFDATHPIVNVVESTGGTSFYFAKSTTECFIGTADAQTIRIHTNDVGRVFIDSSGRVTMPYQPAFRAYGTASYDSRPTPVNFETAVFNIGGHYNTSTYRFTAPVAGTYWFGVYGIAQSTSGQGGLTLRVNGSANLRSYHLPNERTRGITGIFYLNASDYVDVGMEDLTTYYLANYAYFAGYLIG